VIVRRRTDAIFLDPFVRTHSVPENDNNAIDFVVGILTGIALRHNIAVDSPHHTRKGGAADPGNADAGRGGSAFKDGGRLVYTQTIMTTEDAKRFGVSEAERRSIVRMDSAKVNIARPSHDTKWFKLVSVDLGNVAVNPL
jgi:RecA-family ATPase